MSTTTPRLLAPGLVVALIALSLGNTACAPRKPHTASSGAPGSNQETPASNAAGAGPSKQSAPIEFADIPVPKGRKINVDKTMVVGTDVWFGQLTYDTNYAAEAMFNFYHKQLPGYGWNKITAVRAQTSFMTYTRENRVMTIAITPNRILGTEVTITVSPRESQREQAQPASPPALAPAPGPAPVTGTQLAPPPLTPPTTR
ncbi:MAG: hypothetical protein ISR51_04315 [Rhodospirillales bacterium]|nr:hypothetical protein [Alphaproteobacteria bacterium]MBL6947878.1 hypothetical protein [Rhodospirillales bacterium]